MSKKLNNRFNPENSTLRLHQLKMLELLIEIDRICKVNNIQYWLSFGTLLGAIRHKGFIPWDDDLDISMLKKDYDLFLKIMEEYESSEFILQNHKSDNNYVAVYSKFRDLNSKIKETNNNDLFYKYKGVYVDVFCLEPSPLFLSKISSYSHFFAFKASQISNVFFRKTLVNLTCFLLTKTIYPVFRLISMFFNKNTLRLTFGSGMPTPRYVDELFPLKEVVFEGLKFPAPNNFDAYLEKLYGDYMKLPNLDNILTHTSKVELK